MYIINKYVGTIDGKCLFTESIYNSKREALKNLQSHDRLVTPVNLNNTKRER